MSRSFRESYMGMPYQATRGWCQGKKRECAKTSRYKLASMHDEDGLPDLPSVAGKKWRRGLGRHFWNFPSEGYEIVRRNGRKLLRKQR